MNKTTQRHLNDIAERLWNNKASLFVGAGFSKNAHLQSGAKLPPNWDELGDLFFEKSRNRKPNKNDRAYANVLRLAEDVENMCGRQALTELIRNAINDDLLSPSDTHMQLMALPWQDVYTTNYDTLLERSVARLKEQNKCFYTTVRNSQEIGMGSSPFLIKVHGDINEPSSIVITEEDYRTYPVGHQAMVNHIQNAIMTKTLVLIGFSGNDPNFNQWLGWVRDALCNKQRKLYLLSIDNVSEATRKSFEKKNVVVVDIRNCCEKSATPSENVAAVIKYLEEYPYKRERERTDYHSKTLKWGRTSYRDETIDKTFNLWKQEHDSYPGWLVMPRDKREYWANTEGFYLSIDNLSQLKDGKDILFLDLFNWRIEKSLYPIENHWEKIYLSVLAKYKPFSKRCKVAIRTAWLNLKLGLLRLYRQECWRAKWDCLRDELHSLKGKMDEEQRCRFYYEQSLEAVYRNDFKQLEDVLLQWNESQSDFYWDIRRGALWAEYLSFEKGKEITRKAFNKICERFDKTDCEEERFYWASRKVHAHTVWDCMAQANFSDGREETTSARKTWMELRPYEDVWYEREFFESNLRPIEEVLELKTTTASFRLGCSSSSTTIGGNSKDYRVAYAYFLYYEETGFPIHLPYLNSVDKTSLGKALSVMTYCSPAIASCWLLRSGDPKMVPAMYNRRFLERTTYSKVDVLYGNYLDCFNRLLQTNDSKNLPSWVLVFRSILPEILSRLCMKASYEARVKTLDYLDVVFKHEDSVRYDGLDRLLSSLLSSFSQKELWALIPRLVTMAIAPDRLGDCRFEPLYYVRTYGIVLDSLSDVIDELFKRLGTSESVDKAIMYRLLFLDKCKALSEKQRDVLAEKLWSKRDDYGLPAGTFFRRFAFLYFPYPKDVDPQALLKEYFKKQSFPIIGKSSTVSFYGGDVPVLNDIKGTTNNDIVFLWDKALINDICTKIVMMWDSDKVLLLKKDSRNFGLSIKEEIQKRFDDIETIISTIMAPNLQMLDEDNKKGLARIANEFESYDMPSFRMKLALTDILEEVQDVPHEILKRLSSSNNSIIDNCIKAIIFLYNKGVDVKYGVKWMSDFFRSNSEYGRIAIISGLNFFMDKKPYVENGDIRINLLLGLDRLYEDTRIKETDDELTANKKMNLRLSVAPLVKGLMHDILGEFPKTLSIWLDYYNSKETCWDIRINFINDDN